MARTKSTGAAIEEAVTPIKNVEVPEEVVSIETAKAEPIANPKKYIISNNEVQMHTKPDLLQASVSRPMMIGTSYEVVDEVKNIYGAFYKLDNGMYVSKGSNLTVYTN